MNYFTFRNWEDASDKYIGKYSYKYKNLLKETYQRVIDTSEGYEDLHMLVIDSCDFVVDTPENADIIAEEHNQPKTLEGYMKSFDIFLDDFYQIVFDEDNFHDIRD